MFLNLLSILFRLWNQCCSEKQDKEKTNLMKEYVRKDSNEMIAIGLSKVDEIDEKMDSLNKPKFIKIGKENFIYEVVNSQQEGVIKISLNYPEIIDSRSIPEKDYITFKRRYQFVFVVEFIISILCFWLYIGDVIKRDLHLFKYIGLHSTLASCLFQQIFINSVVLIITICLSSGIIILRDDYDQLILCQCIFGIIIINNLNLK